MACRWRIRHKLMIGLGLVIAIMALLLGGTFVGLSSYQATMRTIRSKLVELDKAGKVRDAIKHLTKPSTNLARQGMELLDKLKEAQLSLAEYEASLDVTIEQGQATLQGYNEQSQVEAIKEQFASLELAIRSQKPEVSHDALRPLVDREPYKGILLQLVTTANDLNNAINVSLMDRIELAKQHYHFSFGAVVGISIAGVLLLMGSLGRFYCWVFYPIRDLKKGVDRVAQGDFDKHIEVKSGDEMEELAAGFNHMMDRLRDLYGDLARQVNERSRQLVRSERLASVGYLAAGVAHEINNPLASIAFCSEALEHRLQEILTKMQRRAADLVSRQDETTINKYLSMIQQEAFRCKKITQRLLEFSRTSERQREFIDLSDIVRGVLEMVELSQPGSRGKHLIYQPPGALYAWVNAQEIKSVVLNLVMNALENMDEGGNLTIRQRQQDGMAELMFIDTGCGMSAEVLDNIFEPFFTRSRTGKGTGLGLSISHRIITQHGGEIEATSPGPGQGSTFIVRLPLKPSEDQRSATEPEPGAAAETSTWRGRRAA